MTKIVIATRASPLALWQAHFIGDKLSQLGYEYETLNITTEGDRVQDRYLHEIGGKGLFVKEVERALMDRKADLAVHSLKDVPVRLPDDFEIVATPKRHAREDVLLFNAQVFAKLKVESFFDLLNTDLKNLQFGTSSLRRSYLLEQKFGVRNITRLRGNVNTRLNKLKDGEYDAIVLARASLDRLQLGNEGCVYLPSDEFVPCAGQGALAIEMHRSHPLFANIEKLSDQPTHTEVRIERGVLKKLGGDCTMPCGIHAQVKNNKVSVDAIVLDSKGNCAEYSQDFDLNSKNCEEICNLMIEGLSQNGLAAVFENLGLKLPSN